jgi:hypothetical protein
MELRFMEYLYSFNTNKLLNIKLIIAAILTSSQQLTGNHKDECNSLILRLAISRFLLEAYKDACLNESQLGTLTVAVMF